MAGPITWQSVTAPSTVGATQALYGAQNAVQNVDKSLSGLVDQANKTSMANQQQVVKNNTQDFFNSLQGATPQQLADPAYRAQVEQQRASQGNLIDQAATRDYAQNLLASRQQALEGTQKFDDMQTGVAQRGNEQQVAADILAGNTDAATQHANGLLNQSDWDAKIAAARDKAIGMTQSAQQTADGHNSSVQGLAASKQAMGFSAQDHVFSTAFNKDRLNTLNQTQQADAVVRQMTSKFDQAQKDQATAVKQAAIDLNLPMDNTTGGVDYDNLTGTQAKMLQDTLHTKGLDQNNSATTRNDLIQKQLSGLPVDVQMGALKKAAMLDTTNDVAPADIPRMQTYVAQATAPTTNAMNVLDIQEQKEKAKNVFLNTSSDPEKDGMDIVGNFVKQYGPKDRPTDSKQRALIETVTRGLRNGVEVTLGGKKQMVQLPPSMMANALQSVGMDQGTFNPDSYTPDRLGDYIQDQLVASPDLRKQMQKAPSMATGFAEQKIKLAVKLQADTTDASNQFKQRNGITPNSSSMIDRINQAAKGN